MPNLNKNKIINTNFLYVIFLGIFSFFINFYYSSLGSFPIDTFLHYDSANRILNGELPIRDFWVVSGLTTDYIQAFFFKVFGNNWYAYIIHSSLFNCIIALTIYFFFLSTGLKKTKAFLYSLSFSILSYTISGTPFVDLHATYLLLISTLILINNLNTKKNYLWVLIILLLFLSFFSKQVPSAYAVVAYTCILIPYFIYKKNYNRIFSCVVIAILFLTICYFLLELLEIDLRIFYIQYIDYPRTIGSERLINFDINIVGFFNKYKFIIIPYLILIFLNSRKKKVLENVISLFIISSFIFVIIFHQLMTKNQIYIYFLVPLLFGLVDCELQLTHYKYKKYLSISLILILTFVTFKYHLRFNENRKFHELTKIQLNESVKAEKLHRSLKGLNWKNPRYKGSSLEEIIILNNAQKILNNEEEYKKAMMITHYQFLDSIVKKKLFYPNRTFTVDGASMPLLDNKHFKIYKNFLQKKIIDTRTNKIIFFKHEDISRRALTDYIDRKCFNLIENEIFEIYELSCFK